jgi:hypothetical protein
VTEGNAAAIPDNGGGAVGVHAVGANDAVDAVVGVVGTASDGDAGVVSTYY